MMKKRVKIGSAVVLTLALVFSAIPILGTKAANAVDTDRKCSVEFEINADTFDELDDIEIPILLYKVATINKSGEYTAVNGFESIDFSSVAYDENASAAEWEERAAEAAKLLGRKKATAHTTAKNGEASITGLDTGMYLVVGQEAMSDYYTYNFKPYMISLPNNYFYTTGNDDWVYDLKNENAIGLKPEQEERLGNLAITKTLKNQNITMGEKATFVFEVKYTTPKGVEKKELVTLTFNTAGVETAIVTGIPAGSTVEVTEVYSGASYKLEGCELEGTLTDDGKLIIIAADEERPDEPKAFAYFANSHNDKPNGGYGVVNNYTPDKNGQYQWSATEDNSDKEQ